MKLLSLLLIFVVCMLVNCTNNKNITLNNSPPVGISIPINSEVDKILRKITNTMLQNELDPAFLPDFNKNVVVDDILHVTHTVNVKLKQGWVQDISKVLRDGTAWGSLKFKGRRRIGRAKIPMYLRSVQFGSKFKVYMNILAHCSGEVIGTVDDIKMYLDAQINGLKQKNSTYVLNRFDITDMGIINVRFINSNPLEDGLLNMVADIITNTLHDEIVQVINSTANKIGTYIVENYLN